LSSRLERYTADTLLAPAAQVDVMRHEVRQVDVHWHDFYELVHVTGGRAVHRLNGAPQELVPGSTILLTPADFHELSTDADEQLTYYNVVVQASLLEDRMDGLLPTGLDRMSGVLCQADDLEEDFHRLWQESAVRRPGARGMVEAILQCILIELARRCAGRELADTGAGMSREHEDVRRAVLFVDRHFREPLSLADAAAQAHLSPNYFSERFRELTGTSFQVYLQHRRLAFAHSLLAATELGVTEVSRAAGFNSLSHFGRAYRSRYGTSPTTSRTAVG
jgi:AraC-like DNA-binding protein